MGQQYLRGTQITDAAGNVQFRTLVPSWYGGRTPHVHFKVFLGGNEVVASQIFFPDEITSEVFSTWQPYRQHASKRTTFNNNDPIKQGVYSEITTIRTISGVFVPMVYRMPVMRPCPPASTAPDVSGSPKPMCARVEST